MVMMFNWHWPCRLSLPDGLQHRHHQQQRRVSPTCCCSLPHGINDRDDNNQCGKGGHQIAPPPSPSLSPQINAISYAGDAAGGTSSLVLYSGQPQATNNHTGMGSSAFLAVTRSSRKHRRRHSNSNNNNSQQLWWHTPIPLKHSVGIQTDDGTDDDYAGNFLYTDAKDGEKEEEEEAELVKLCTELAHRLLSIGDRWEETKLGRDHQQQQQAQKWLTLISSWAHLF